MIEMKPCPFCGGKPEINRCVDMPDGVSLGAQVVCFNPLCPAHVGATGHTEAEAIAAWQSRQNISDVLIEALEPFALIAEHDIGDDEADEDRFAIMMSHNRAPRPTVGMFRRALDALRQAKGDA